MNRRDRELMNRLYVCTTMVRNLPSNPANIGENVKVAQEATRALRDIGTVFSHLMYGDVEEAREEVGYLEESLGVRR